MLGQGLPATFESEAALFERSATRTFEVVPLRLVAAVLGFLAFELLGLRRGAQPADLE